MKNSFPESTVLRGRCAGYLDATCLFVRRPSINQRRFWRGDKRRHCFVAQAVVDPHGRIRHLVVGFPGGISNDRGLYISTDLYLNASAYFSAGEFLCADGGYPGDGPLLIPYSAPQIASHPSPDDARALNSTITFFRSRVEHVFGRVKRM